MKHAGVISMGFMGLHHHAFGMMKPSGKAGYGPLYKDVDNILELPKGFTYKIISRKGTKMTDGFLVPGAADGMATFKENGKVIIVRNHELSPGDLEQSPYGENKELLSKIDKDLIYDFGRGKKIGVGGTSNLVFNEKKMEVEREFLSLTGTYRNCAGGPTPWGTWITCEETTARADNFLEKDHGYNFEVKASSTMGVQQPMPLKAMGRFSHEAVAVDPKTGIVYQTEDDSEGLIYRFIPEKYGDMTKGKLQVLAIKDKPSFDTRNWKKLNTEPFPLNKAWAVEWLDIDDIESPESDINHRGFENGAARFARGEGMWYGSGEIYFACTNGGKENNGQIFKYIPSKHEAEAGEDKEPGTLELFIESHDSKLMQFADNLTIAPWGDVVVAEDKSDPRLVGITPEGEMYHIAKNIGYKSEFAGVCFSPSGDTLFVNIQSPGLTLAIQGPWGKGRNSL
ncbi:PhoX family phosphatase [Membranihabitans marinus]